MYARALLIILPLGLAGCADVGIGLSAASSLSRMWLDWPPAEKQVAGPPAPEAPLYCYRTLGQVECHARPLATPEDEARLIGHVGPDRHVP
jgi:hypothetical protein